MTLHAKLEDTCNEKVLSAHLKFKVNRAPVVLFAIPGIPMFHRSASLQTWQGGDCSF
jgi:hypothetical protein